MRQEEVRVRPIVQMTGEAEFSEVFFDGARTDASNVVGGVHEGWKIAMATLGFERGASTLGQQLKFAAEFEQVLEVARRNGAAADPVFRQHLANAWIGLRVMRFHALRALSQSPSGELGREAVIMKLYWSTWHQNLGKLAMDVLGAEAEITASPPYELKPLQRLFLFSRADTIYAGTSEIQRNIIAHRALGLPREPRLAGPAPSARS